MIMTLILKRLCSKSLAKPLALLVFVAAICYSANVCAHVQQEPLQEFEVLQAPQAITIELADVAELDKVAIFTKLLGENQQLADLKIQRVSLDADRPQQSFVRWTAKIISGTPDALEQDLQDHAGQFEGLKIVHRQSYQGHVAFALVPTDRADDGAGELLPAPTRPAWSIPSGGGFD